MSSSDRKSQILAAAIKFFSKEGFDGSTHEFAKKLGISQPLIYRYFPSKDDLVREVYRSVFEDRWDPSWEGLIKNRSKSLKARLIEFYTAYTAVVFERDWMRIYLFSGLKGLDINRWWINFVEVRILSSICDELRFASGEDSVAVTPATPIEMEILWSFQGSIFYYAMRGNVYLSKSYLEFQPFLEVLIDSLVNAFASIDRSESPARLALAAV